MLLEILTQLVLLIGIPVLVGHCINFGGYDDEL
jgi:hypothetical protein